jgi:uncharacterized protein YhaN
MEVKKVMGDKCDKESLIKTLTQENLRLANECLELHQDGKVNIYLRQEIETLKDKITQNEQRVVHVQGQFQAVKNGYEDCQQQLEGVIKEQ